MIVSALQVPAVCRRRSDGTWLAQELQRAAQATVRQQQRAAHSAALHALPGALGGPPSCAAAGAALHRTRDSLAAAQLDAEATALQTLHTRSRGTAALRSLHAAERGWMRSPPAPDVPARQERAWAEHEWEAARMQQVLAAAHEAALLDKAAQCSEHAAATQAAAGMPFDGTVAENIKCATRRAACGWRMRLACSQFPVASRTRH